MNRTSSIGEWPYQPFALADDELIIAGRPISQIAEDLGSTPFYVYDGNVIDKAVQHVRSAMPDQIKLYYAVKANPMPDVLSYIKDRVDGFDIASSGELKTLLQVNANTSNISFAGPGKTDAELAAAIQSNVTISIESRNELARVAIIGEKTAHLPNVCMRINPNFTLKASGMKMAGGPQQFGVDEEQAPEILKDVGAMDLNFLGFHIYTGSQNLHADQIIRTQDAIFALAVDLSEFCQDPIRLLNIGGGFGIPYFSRDTVLDLDSVGDNLGKQMEQVQERLGRLDVILELGRYLVGEAGVYITRVIDKKVSRGQIFLITDGGMNHHLAASGNLGQVIRKNFPIVNALHVTEGLRETVNITGPLCTPLDLLGHQVEIAETQVGDLIAIMQSGAYGYSASPLTFLSHQPPMELLL